MRRVFGSILSVLVLVAAPSAGTVAQTQQLQQKATVAGKEATKAVSAAGAETQDAVAHPDTHKKTILILTVAILLLAFVLLAALRRGRRKTIIRTRR